MNIKKFIKYLFIFVVLLFNHSFSVYAKENFKINNIKVLEHNEEIEIEDIEYSNNTITSPITFKNINDFITLEIEVQNNTDTDFILESINNSFEGDSLDIDSNSIGNTIKAGKKESIQVKVQYINDITDRKITMNQPSISLNFQKVVKINNPLTKNQRPYQEIIVIAIVIIVFIYAIFKRKKEALLLLLLFIPCLVAAKEGEIITITFDKVIVKKNKIRIPITPTIYWALQDNNNDSVKETLIISSEEVTGIQSGSIPGDTVFTYDNRAPWYCNTVTTINIEGTVAPASTAYWFKDMGFDEPSFTADLSNLNVSNVTDMSCMFNAAGRIARTWSVGDLSEWDTSDVTNMGSMFYNAGTKAATWTIGDIGNWDTSNVTNMSNMFLYAGWSASTWSVGDLSEWDISNVVTLYYMFCGVAQNATTWTIGDISNWDTSNVVNIADMFYNAAKSATTWYIGDLSGWDTSNVYFMNEMFYYAGYNASTFNLDLSNWNTSNVSIIENMFSNAGNNATNFSIKIPRTNGNGLDNTTSLMYGNSSSVSVSPPEGRSFTLAS